MITVRVPNLKQLEADTRKAADDYNCFSRETPINEIALAIIARCDDLKAECDKLLKFADSAKPEPVQSSPITFEQVEQYLSALSAKMDFFDPGPREVERCFDLVKSYDSSDIYAAFKEIFCSDIHGRFSVEDFVFRVSRVARERRNASAKQ